MPSDVDRSRFAQGVPGSRRRLGGWSRPVALVLLLSAVAVLLVPALQGAEPDGRSLYFDLWRTRHVALALVALWGAVVIGLGSRSLRVAAGLFASTVALGASLVVLEGLGFALEIDWRSLLSGGGKMMLGHEAQPHVEAQGLAQQDIAFACGLDFPQVPFRYRSDQRGFRNEVDRDAADVYLVGDSFLVAGLVPSDELVSSRLERALGRPVMNVALSGISPQRERDLLLASGLPLDGRLVLQFVFEGNDLEDSARYMRGEDPEVDSSTLLDRSLTVALVVQLQRASQRLVRDRRGPVGLLDGEPYLFGWLRSSSEPYRDQCQVLGDALLDFRQQVESRGGRYGLVLIPSKLRVLGPFCTWPADSTISSVEPNLSPLRDYLTSWAETTGVPFLDLTEPLTGSVEAGEVPWFPADTHWNARGHEVAAQAVLTELAGLLAGGASDPPTHK